MSNPSDKDIDRLSREAADSYEPDSSFLSWSRLEQRLAEQMPERPPDGFRFGRVSPYVWGPAIMIFAGMSYFLIKNSFYSQHSTQTANSVQSEKSVSKDQQKNVNGNSRQSDSIALLAGSAIAIDKNASKDSAGSHAGKNIIGVGKADGVKGGNANAGSGANKSDVLSDKAHSGVLPAPDNSTPTVSNDKSNIASTANSNRYTGNKTRKLKYGKAASVGAVASASAGASASSDAYSSFGATVNSGGLAGSNSLTQGNIAGYSDKNKISATSNSKNTLSLPALASTGESVGKVKGNEALLNTSGLSNPAVPQKTLHLNRSLSIGLAFGPDYTHASNISNDQFGNNVGLTIGYYLTGKFSLNTGIIYSNKFYWTGDKRNGSFVQSYATRPGPAAPMVEYVNSSANLYEIPLTLRYDFAQHQKMKYFANAGLSSYFLLDQTSISYFHNGNQLLAWKAVDNSQTNYWFDVADFSLGLETDIGRGLSFQVEPFMKVPLKNMGMQNAKLTTYGVLLSIRFAPVLSKSKK